MVAYTYLLSLLAATAAIASPAPIPDNDFSLEPRAGQNYICRAGKANDGQVFGTVSQDKAIGYFRQAKTKPGKSGYPAPFSNIGKPMKFASGCNKDVWELPVLANGKPYDYNKKKDQAPPGEMRVFYTKDLKFCGIGSKEKRGGTGNPTNCELVR